MDESWKVTTPTLAGGRVRLEPMTEEHLAGLEAVAFDARIWRYMMTRVGTVEELRGWMGVALELERAGTVMPWVTVFDGRVVGATRFMDLDRRNETVELGNTWLSPEVQGMGVNAEAKLLQLRYGFEEMGLRRIALKTHHENLQSQAAMRKLGAVEEGTFRNHYVMPDGSQRHSVWFSITREEWPGVRSRLEERVRTGAGSRPCA